MRKGCYFTIVIVALALLSLISGPAMAVHEREERGPNIFSEISERVSMGGLVLFNYYWADIGLLSGSSLGEDFSQSDVLATNIILDFDAEVNDWVNIYAALYYEEEGISYVSMFLQNVHGVDAPEPEVTWDEAVVTMGDTEKFPFYLAAGKMYIPFGALQTHFVHDPLMDAPMTLIMGETQKNAVLLGAEQDGFSVSAYTFRGEWDNNVASQYGVDACYERVCEEGPELLVGASYISNIAESDHLAEVIQENIGSDEEIEDEVEAYAAYFRIGIAGAFLEAEYMAAMDKFDPNELANDKGEGAEPWVLHLEAGYNFNVMDRPLEVALQYAMNDELLILPDERYGICAHLEIFSNTTLSAAYCHDEFNDANPLGIDEVDWVVSQLEVQF